MPSNRSAIARLAAVPAAVLAVGGSAQAHHAMGGAMPETLWQGFVSGLAHPVIGPDHLAFIVAIGLAAGLLPVGWRLVAAFVAASTVGVLAHVARLDVPLAETLVALSVVVAGGLLALSGRVRQPVWLLVGFTAGLVHGYAFGESIVGAERQVVGAYLVGIAVIMAVIALGFANLAPRFLFVGQDGERRLQVAGAILGCVGVVMLAGSLVAA